MGFSISRVAQPSSFAHVSTEWTRDERRASQSCSVCNQTSCPQPPCNNPFADKDGDGDVDMNDFAAFQRCYTGSAGGVPAGCSCYDRDHSGAIDSSDFAAFKLCATRDKVPADPNCDGAP